VLFHFEESSKPAMSVNTLKANKAQANRKVASLVRRPRQSNGECVLVVYDKHEANIYFEEGQAASAKEPQPT
jgi:hypothetical protein